MNNLFSGSNLIQISDIVKNQFPAFYRQHGEGFIDFIQAYYEWLEEQNNPVGELRSIYNEFDIDRASTEFLNHFRKKYMWGLPPELLGNQRLLQKHILELYRAKGAQSSIRLLFRLLFNEDIDFYIPSYDIFKLSDNTWVEPKYLEVSRSPQLSKAVNTYITGSISGATAIVESYESRYINNLMIDLLFISNIVGEFIPDESIIIPEVDPTEYPIVIGSPTEIEVISSSPGLAVGTPITAVVGDKPVRAIVSETYQGIGNLSFNIINSGSLYTMDAVFVPEGTPTGDGADIKIGSLKDQQPLEINSDNIIDFVDVPLNATYPFPAFPDSNTNTIIADSLSFYNILVGSIDRIVVLSPGAGYTSNTYFRAIDPHTSTLGLRDANNEIMGMNALVQGIASLGEEVASKITVISSGYHNLDETILFVSDENDSLSVSGRAIFGGVGFDEGYYDNTKSFLSNDKYLFDGHYYQDYSYVIQSSFTLERYIDVLKQLVHPAGNAVYSDIRIFAFNQFVNDAFYVDISMIKNADILSFDHTDEEEYTFVFTSTDTNDYIGVTDIVDNTIPDGEILAAEDDDEIFVTTGTYINNIDYVTTADEEF